MDIGFLVQLADGRWGHFTAPQSLCNVLHPAHRHPGQIHLYQRLLHAALPPPVTLDDCRLERHSFQPGNMERDVPRGRGKVPVIVAAPVPLPRLAALIPRRLR